MSDNLSSINNNTTEESTLEQLSEKKAADDLLLKEKIRKNLLWVSIFSIIMLFAGITSGYIVASGSDFWVVIDLPNQFFVSTFFLIISSLAVFGATHFIKNKKPKLITPLLGFALCIGLGFGYFQYKGFQHLSENGNAVRAGIINVEGKFGEFYNLYYNNKEISFDGYDYYWEGEKLSPELKQKMISFCDELQKVALEKEQPLSNYGEFVVKYKNKPIVHLNNRLEIDGLSLSPDQKGRLSRFSESVVSGRGDFYMIGKYGEDFTIKYKGKEISYKNRKFYREDQELSAYQLNQLNTSQNRTGSFIFAFILVHGLHWFAGIIVLLVLFINALKGKYTTKDYIGLKIGSIYWHFLGILWLYLYAFLNFIH